MWTTLKITGLFLVAAIGLSACFPQQSSGPGSGFFGGGGNPQPAPDPGGGEDNDGGGGGSYSPDL